MMWKQVLRLTAHTALSKTKEYIEILYDTYEMGTRPYYGRHHCGRRNILWQYNQIAKPQMVNSDGRTFEKAQVVEIMQDNIQEDGSRVGDQIVSLQMESGPHAGEIVQANCPNGLLFGTVCQSGM